MPADYISIKNAHQNNLKGIDVQLPLNKLIVITGVSGSGKSSLAFDTLYAEGQRRYVETFSPYTRQFLERMDKPGVDRIDGIPPAIAIDQVNPVRTSRSTVGTMTELNDHIKLLFARAARLYCRGCGKHVQRDTPESIWNRIAPTGKRREGQKILITFPVTIPHNFTEEEVKSALLQQGYERIHVKEGKTLEVVQDRLILSHKNRSRIIEDLETALLHGRGLTTIHLLDEDLHPRDSLRFSSHLHCPDCHIHYDEPVPNLFSFNSPIGACETCRGFGRIIDIDETLVIPDSTKTLAEGAIKPWQTETYRVCQNELEHFARRKKIPLTKPWCVLSDSQKRWVFEGEGEFEDGKWYGVRRFFKWLETKSYKMHIRVLLSKYRMYKTCYTCGGTRLKDEALLWRLGPGNGLSMHDVMLLPIDRCRDFFLDLGRGIDKDDNSVEKATGMLLDEILTRLTYLVDVGLGYLSLDRQSRTLSGGEVQRINLTTALGTSLVNTLFVLDEPSIGLHSRDIGRLIKILHRLRDTGNTLIVVEHDPEVIRSADLVLDMGPGPGEQGGNVIFFGAQEELQRSPVSLTAAYLNGSKHVISSKDISRKREKAGLQQYLEIIGAQEHNLKNIDVRIPLNRFVCITGVSGSGKSTLVQDVCYNALCKLKAKPVEQPGRYRQINGHELIDDVVLVDQSPIGKTTRSNPASYVGAFGPIRKLFAAEPLARMRMYRTDMFSFNSRGGKCPGCGGSGFERIEMQFLSDVYIRCPDCHGKRYRPEILEVRLHIRGNENICPSIADVMKMTVTEACCFFRDFRDVLRMLEPLRTVGLGYLTLGQPVPTLSGGEAQRLKLAGHIAKKTKRKKREDHILFLFDEPTTGLHFDDIARLLDALRRLCDSGHSVVVIEHNLDVVRAADWIIDLGPEGGEKGGEVVCTGTPDEVARYKVSYTGRALSGILSGIMGKTLSVVPPAHGAAEKQALPLKAEKKILIRHARENNLQNIDVSIPHNTLTVVTGVSGSGKSTLVFDILFSEGQRRYLESLNAYVRQYVQPAKRPDVDAVSGIPPAVAIEQRSSRGGRKSTVATMTEIYHFLRLLFAKLGTRYCPDCGIPIRSRTAGTLLETLLHDYNGKEVSLYAPLVVSRKGYYTDLAQWASSRGYSYLRVDGKLLSTDSWPRLDRFQEHRIELPAGAVRVNRKNTHDLEHLLHVALEVGNGAVYVEVKPGGGTSVSAQYSERIFSTRRVCPRCSRSFEELDPRLFSFNSKHGFCPACCGTGRKGEVDNNGKDKEIYTDKGFRYDRELSESIEVCPLCSGSRLKKEALAVKFMNMSIAEVTALSITAAFRFFSALDLKDREAAIARDILAELRSRLHFLCQVGLPYLTLDRASPSLSSGEAQRIRLAAQLGSNLRGVCYILDEPTIGLHARDNRTLMETLRGLKLKGNTVVVVEHDEETIRQAEHIIDLGPGGGKNGGKLVFEGSVDELLICHRSLTGRYLRSPITHPLVIKKRGELKKGEASIEIRDAYLHNLHHLNVTIPLGRLICVTGVSGSGKSSLVQDVLYGNLQKVIRVKKIKRSRKSIARTSRSGKTGSGMNCIGCESIEGGEAVQRVLEVDQTPIGRTPRSCPATYVGFWKNIRELFSHTPDARMRGYGPARFSFNVEGGRCPVCKGQGIRKIEMSFLPDVKVLCEACNGIRFTHETCEVMYRDKSIADVLAMSVDEALTFFATHQYIRHALSLLQEVGLGYLSLGQQSPSLSGGEAQRIKLVAELVKTRPVTPHAGQGDGRKNRSRMHTLYVLDEPTIGLHMADVKKLIQVLHKLVDSGNTVIIIEHNLDLIAEADWIIDLGPEGGERGGFIVAEGPPEKVAGVKNGSYTAGFLARFLKRKGGE
jgi:excinuclease ABC subunit A